MKFTKLAKSDKFEYMMLSRLIQDAKYFIDHPDLKHLWARTLDEHIKQMKEQYAKLDPKPEWTSEEEINNLAKQMKESYTNHLNEVHPDNKIEATIQQPNKPKPTTMLPDNMQWAWDPEAADWVAVLKDNTNTTPPLYDPNNQNVVNQTTSYMSNIKSGSEKNMMELAQNIIHDVVLIHKAKSMDSRTEWDGTFAILTLNPEKTDIIDIKYVPQSSLTSYTPNDNEYGLVRTRDTGFDETDYQLQPLEMIIRQRTGDSSTPIELENKKQSSCLAKFLDGPQYSKEIKIEAGLIKDGLVKYAGFDFNRGTKYSITEKGLKVLRSAAEKEHNEALNEREKLAYLFGFNTDKETTLDTTGKTIKADDKDIIVIDTGSGYLQVFENDDTYDYGGYSVGEQLYEFSINDEDRRNGKATLDVDDLLNSKFYGIIFEDFDKLEWFVQNIKDSNTQQEIKNLLNKEAKGVYSSKNTSNRRYTIIESDGTPLGKVTASSQLDALVKFGIKHPEYADSQSICAKQVCADENAVETTYVSVKELKSFLRQNGAKEVNFGTFVSDIIPSGLVKKMVAHGTKKIRLTYDEYKLDVYANGARLIENLAIYDGNWKDKYYKFSTTITAQYEQTTEQHLDYPNPSETPNDHIVLENHDGWVNTASFEDDVKKQFQQPHQKLPNSDRDLALLEKQILEITDEDTRDTVRKIFDEFQFSDKEAAEHRPYTEEEKRLLPLFRLLNQHIAKKEIQIVEDPQKDGNIVATGSAEVINELEHKVKDLGFYCEPIAEITDNDDIGQDIYSLKIFYK